MGRKSSRTKSELNRATDKFNRYMKAFEDTQFRPLDLTKLQQENVYEDIQVDTTAADYATRQFQQQQANIMNAFKGVAGSSGVAGLAQTLSNQASSFAERTGLGISEQERSAENLRRQETARLQGMQTRFELANQEGFNQFEQDKLATLMGVQGQQIAGIRKQIANQQQAQSDLVGTVATAMIMGSDRRLKKNIKKVGTSPSGLGVYEFEFKDKVYGEGKYQGAMSEEVPSNAKQTNADGYEEVDYAKIDVDFKKIS
jgi:hypothetical protein